jgi:hypothetical protein
MAKPWLWKWGVVYILVVDAYSRMELCTPILLGEASKKIWMENHFQKISKLTMDTSLNKAQHKQELLYGSYLALVGMCM